MFVLAVFAALLALATAGATNGQNAITSPLGGSLNAGRPITITWKVRLSVRLAGWLAGWHLHLGFDGYTDSGSLQPPGPSPCTS